MFFKYLTYCFTFFGLLSAGVSFFYYANSLYESSPEKERLSYSKYLAILQLDLIPGENTALVFEGDRLKLLVKFRLIILTSVIVVFSSVCVRGVYW